MKLVSRQLQSLYNAGVALLFVLTNEDADNYTYPGASPVIFGQTCFHRHLQWYQRELLSQGKGTTRTILYRAEC